MRCISCNCILTDKEATRKYASTGSFIDLCDNCFSHVEADIPHIEGQGRSDDYDETAYEQSDV